MTGRKLTTEEYIARANKVHHGKYTYERTKYVNATTPVIVTCPEHGDFTVDSPFNHLRGFGVCPDCRPIKLLTKDAFVERARKVWGDKYDYSKVVDPKSHNEVTIICRKHNVEFQQSAYAHLSHYEGCPECKKDNPRNWDTEKFIVEARKIHGDKYDYSQVEYVDNKTEVIIKCNVCGTVFKQKPQVHILHKCGCPECGRRKNALARRRPIEKFVEKAKAKHGDRYDYSNARYDGDTLNVIIRCPVHGEVTVDAAKHLQGCICPKCREEKKMTTEKFIAKAKEIWGDKFDYSETVYTGYDNKVTVYCKECGKTFEQYAGALLKKIGCPYCTGRNRTTEEFIRLARAKHGDKFDYSMVKYVNTKTPVKIKCNDCGYVFEQTPQDHLQATVCPRCHRPNYKMTFEEFLTKAREIHGDKYDYTRVKENWDKIKNIQKDNVEIWCNVHNCYFKQTPYSHVVLGCGCTLCNKGLSNAYKISLLTENDIQKNPADNRFFCLRGVEIYYFYRAGLVPKEALQIATTKRGTRPRINAVLRVSEDLQNQVNSGEEGVEVEDEGTIEENYIEAIEQLDELETNDDDMVLDDETGLPLLERQDILRNGDINGLDRVDPTSENGRAIVENTLQTWFQTISKKPEFVEEIRNYHGSKFYDYIKELFFESYNAVTTMKNPAGYSLNYELYPYQKLLAYKLEKRDSYSMWLDMGGGKTNCALYASRHNNLRNNVVIAPKSVLHESWVSQIYEAFPDSKIIAMFGISVDDFKSKKDTESSRKYNAWLESHLTVLRNLKEFKGFGSGYTYLLINYDKFSQDYAKKLADTIACNHIDYVVLDEVQNVKVRNRKTTSERHVQVGYLMSQIRKCNPNLKTSALTGTPVLNDIMEAKSIVEITTGEEVSGVKNNRVTLPNVVEANKALLLNGFRYCPTIPINHTTRNIEIECSPETERQIRRLCYMGRNTFYSELESILTIAKINSPEVINELKPGTIVYLLFPYKNNTATEVVRKIESLGFKVGTYFGCTVDKHQAYSDFVEGRTDILVASSPVCEGVDGLQNRCDNMIILSLPQTYGKYDQLIKRIVRRRKEDSELKDKEVTIIIPQMFIELNENDDSDEDEWSWDRSRWIAIRYKKSLADAVVDGELQKVFTIDWNKLYRNAMKVFQKGIKDEEPVVKSKIVVEVPEKEKKARERATCVVMETHRLANSSNHHTTHQRFVDNPQEFDNYHDNRELSKADWVEDPVERIAAYINKRFKNKKIADLGCGTNKLSTLMKNGNTVTGFDHQQYKGNKDVVVADIGNLKGIVNDREYDVAVFCLSLWGKDYEDYFDEAHRILKDYRKMLIVEPVSNFGDGKRYGSPTEFIQTVEKHGFARLGGVEERNNFAYFRFEKE